MSPTVVPYPALNLLKRVTCELALPPDGNAWLMSDTLDNTPSLAYCVIFCVFAHPRWRVRFVMHLRWPANLGPKNDSFTLGDNPQLSLSVKSGATAAASAGSAAGSAAAAAAAGGAAAATACKKSPTVWVLLSR